MSYGFWTLENIHKHTHIHTQNIEQKQALNLTHF